MSINQFTQPNEYVPAVHFADMKCDNADIANFDLPVNFSSDRTATPPQRIAMLASGTNTVLSLQTNVPGAGCFVQFANPNGDNDFLIGVSDINQNFVALKQDLHFRDENFLPALTVYKTPGQGLSIENPSLTSYTPSKLTAYESKLFNAVAVNGFVATPAINIKCVRIGNSVTITISGVSGETGTGGIVSCTAAISEQFRPSLATDIMNASFSNSLPDVGRCTILPTGDITFEYAPSTLFPAQPNSGWDAFSGSYCI